MSVGHSALRNRCHTFTARVRQTFTNQTHVGRLVFFATMRHWREPRRVGFGEQFVGGAEFCRATNVVGFVKSYDARKLQPCTALHGLSSLGFVASKTVKHHALGHAFTIENIKCVWPRVAGVNDERQIQLLG